MKRRIPMALLVVGAVGFYACSDGPVAVDDVGNPLFGGPPATLPSITAGGITLNIDAGPNALSIGGFNARATGPGVVGVLPVFGTAVTVYPARGQVQAKSMFATGPGSLHAEVVCIANLGPSGLVGGGGISANDVWEIRIKVTKTSFAGLLGNHGSAFVQDNGTGLGVDFADENFDEPGNANCGETTSFQLEEVLQGSITVRD